MSTAMQAQPSTPNGSPSLLDRHGAAQLLNFSVRTVDTRIATGDLPHVRLGRLIRFKPSDLAAYIEANRVPGKGEVNR